MEKGQEETTFTGETGREGKQERHALKSRLRAGGIQTGNQTKQRAAQRKQEGNTSNSLA